MPVKRFIAADMRRALVMVREELGEDAMIMSTERTKKGVELIASADDQETLITSQQAAVVDNKRPQARTPFSNNVRTRNARLSPRLEPTFDDNSHSHGQLESLPSRKPDQLGLASGKTPNQLADELELAREKMLASKRQESMTIEELANDANNKSSQSPYANQTQSKASQTGFSQQRQPTNIDHPSVASIEARIDQLMEKTSQDQVKVSEKTDQDIRELQSEILSMRSLFAEQLSTMADMQKQHFSEARARRDIMPMAQVVKQRLADLGLTQACNDSVLQSLKSLDSQTMSAEGLWKESLARLSHRIKTTDGDLTEQGGVFAFWGPTGVGKTTTIAKLAARYVIEHGPKNIVLLSTDCFRIAAHEQLKSLGKILGVSVEIIDDLATLPKRLNALRNHDLVLIDTPGMSQQDDLLNKHLKVFHHCKNIHHVLTLSANSQYQMMQACVHSYRAMKINSCVLTKLDECASLGDGISVLAMNKLPLSYITDGQSVPEDIATMRPHQLVTKAVSLSKYYRSKTRTVKTSASPDII